MPDPIEPLRQALAFSPDNLPLRRHLADSLVGLGRFAEAEAEFRELLKREPNDPSNKVGLANVYYQQGKNSAALVIVEDLLKKSDIMQ